MRPVAKSHFEDEIGWDASLALYREQLRFYLDYLIECDCNDGILAKVEAEVKDESVPDGFKLRFLVRALMRHIIQHMRECAQMVERIDGKSHDSPTSANRPPALERLIYLLRDILDYSTRDTSLLVGITDAQVEKLLSCARKCVDMYEGPSSIRIENPDGTYFRWKFVGLHFHS